MTLLTIDEVKTFPTSELPTSEKHKDTEKKGKTHLEKPSPREVLDKLERLATRPTQT
jgi:hypothetical protein